MSRKISVLTVSKRTGWEDLAAFHLLNQSLMPDEWVVVSEEPAEIGYLNGINIKCLQAPAHTRPSNLNASLNHGLAHCEGDLVIFYQDLIELPYDCIEKLYYVSLDYSHQAFITTATHEGDKFDARYLGVDCVRPCKPEEWEANVALAPMDDIYQLGGFDEEYDNQWSWDNVNLAERASMLPDPPDFLIDETNKPNLIAHIKGSSLPPNGEFHAQRMREIREGTRPLKVPYLEQRRTNSQVITGEEASRRGGGS